MSRDGLVQRCLKQVFVVLALTGLVACGDKSNDSSSATPASEPQATVPASELPPTTESQAPPSDVAVPEEPTPIPTEPEQSPPPPPPKPVTREFNNPRVRVAEGNLPLDNCREWGQNCGKPAADAYCQSKGMVSAVDFRMAMDSTPSVVWSTKQVCREKSCDRITWIKCVGSAMPTPAITSEAKRAQGHRLRLRAKQVPEQ